MHPIFHISQECHGTVGHLKLPSFQFFSRLKSTKSCDITKWLFQLLMNHSNHFLVLTRIIASSPWNISMTTMATVRNWHQLNTFAHKTLNALLKIHQYNNRLQRRIPFETMHDSLLKTSKRLKRSVIAPWLWGIEFFQKNMIVLRST